MGMLHEGRASADMGGSLDPRFERLGDAEQSAAVDQKLRDHHREQSAHQREGDYVANALRAAGFDVDRLRSADEERLYGFGHAGKPDPRTAAINQKEFESVRPKRSGPLEDIIRFIDEQTNMLRESVNKLCTHTDRVQGTPPSDLDDGAKGNRAMAADEGPAILRVWNSLQELSDVRRAAGHEVDRAATLIDL